MALKADRLGDVVAQACLFHCEDARVVEKAHHSKTAEALLVRQHLEKVSAEAIDSMMDEIQGTYTPADMWQVEKRISAHVSHKRAKAYGALVKHHNSMSDYLMGKDRSGGGSSEIADAEKDFRKSISTLVSTMITESAKVPGEHGVALTSSILCLVPTLPLDPVLAPSIDLPLEKECKITLGNASWTFPVSQSIMSSLPSSPLTWRGRCPHGGWEIHHQIWSGCNLAHHIYTTSHGLSFLQKTCKHPCPHTSKRSGNPKCMQLSSIEGTPYVTSGYSGSY